KQIRVVRLERVDGRRSSRHRRIGEAHRAWTRRHRDLGPPGQREAPVRRAQVLCRGGRGGHRLGAGHRPFRTLCARHEGRRRRQERRHRHLHFGCCPDGQSDPAMKALVYGVPPEPSDVPDDANLLTRNLANSPVGLRDVPDPVLLHDDWVITRPRLTGICGSDSKQILLDFGESDIDNAMAAFCSFPQVMGHEVVADVVSLGAKARGLAVGQRVVLNPWLSCGPRGIEPPCPACETGDYSLCWSFCDGDIKPGIHTGVSSDVTGGYAELMAAHDTMLFPVPDSVPDELAVFADPFSVSLHSITRHPPPSSGRVLVYGAGSLGLCAVAVLRALYPEVAVAVVARFEIQADLARKFGAEKVFRHEPRLALVEEL